MLRGDAGFSRAVQRRRQSLPESRLPCRPSARQAGQFSLNPEVYAVGNGVTGCGKIKTIRSRGKAGSAQVENISSSGTKCDVKTEIVIGIRIARASGALKTRK